MRYFPIFIDLENQKVVIVGGGETAAQKTRLLLKTKVRITVISTSLTSELKGLVATGRISTIKRAFRPSDFGEARLIYAASDNPATDQAVSKAAQELNIPVNVVDNQAACSFITPAIVDRAPVVVAVSTEGAAPVLAREIKSRLEAMLPVNFGALARFAARLRPVIAEKIKSAPGRRHFWQGFFKGPARDMVLEGGENKAWQITNKTIDRGLSTAQKIGRISLIGVGADDPDLLTLKAQARLQEADLIVLDGLVNPDILEFARRDARRLYVGKTPGQRFCRQSEINAAMEREALQGHLVVRLQGGDSLHFLRAIDELKPLDQVNIKTEIIPGVSPELLKTTLNKTDRSIVQAIAAKG